jgi:transcriptional regulator of arginine metabolism
MITSVDYANNLVVIKTLAGNANSAEIAIDEMRFPEVLGTVAGDDTLLIISRTNSDAEVIVKTLKTL